jgi:hypothetical protein
MSARSYVNSPVAVTQAAFRWPVAEDLIPAATWHALQAVPGLKRGRSAARETDPLRPVDDQTVKMILPNMA